MTTGNIFRKFGEICMAVEICKYTDRQTSQVHNTLQR